MALDRDLVIVHSSDLHLGTDSIFSPNSSADGLATLSRVLQTAAAATADLVVLAGDTFDHNRQPSELVERAGQIMAGFPVPIVILPGNHDPLTPDSVYRRAEFWPISNVCVLGLTVDEAAAFPALGVEVRGRAHTDYSDMSPLVSPRPRSTRWRLVAAHGHYVEEPEEPGRPRGSWLIRPGELASAGADYIALGHWNRAARVGDRQINAYYSGSPDYAGTVNVVRLCPEGSVEVSLVPLRGSAPRPY